jgi:hypothetical protein
MLSLTYVKLLQELRKGVGREFGTPAATVTWAIPSPLSSSSSSITINVSPPEERKKLEFLLLFSLREYLAGCNS